MRNLIGIVEHAGMVAEGRDAPLYHATTAEAAEAILASNVMEPRTDQRVGGKTVHGVSLTRTPGFSKQWAGVKFGSGQPIVTLVLDQAAIARTSRIVPLDWFQTYDENKVRAEIDAKSFGDAGYARRQAPHMKDEEFVIGPIRWLRRVLRRIEWSPEAEAAVACAPKRFPLLAAHLPRPIHMERIGLPTLREWLRLVEQDRNGELFWFWYRPSDGRLEHTDGTHSTKAYYDMGYGVPGEDFDDLADEDILSRALNDGWVRGRYGNRRPNGRWNALQVERASDLSLQGKRDLVLKTARFVAERHPFENLYIDFTIDGAVHDAMDSLHLTGDRLEAYLRRGVIRAPARGQVHEHQQPSLTPRLTKHGPLLPCGMTEVRRARQMIEDPAEAGLATKDLLLYHGTTPAKARSIAANGLTPRGRNNTFCNSISFSDKPVGTRFYDKGAVLVFAFVDGAKLISLSHYQRHGKGDADAVAGAAEGYYGDREIAVFNPSSVRLLGYYNVMTKAVDAEQPVYPKGFHHSWNAEE